MEHAKDLLENTYQKINVIAQSVGYRNVSYFCQSFREYYGISPQKYRGKGD
jgi:two-component system response regulator YesN